MGHTQPWILACLTVPLPLSLNASPFDSAHCLSLCPPPPSVLISNCAPVLSMPPSLCAPSINKVSNFHVMGLRCIHYCVAHRRVLILFGRPALCYLLGETQIYSQG